MNLLRLEWFQDPDTVPSSKFATYLARFAGSYAILSGPFPMLIGLPVIMVLVCVSNMETVPGWEFAMYIL